jgi:drug/metabolite transporter (DMT)-like permease
MDWFALAIICAMAVASADAFTKKYFQGHSAYEIVIIRFGLSGLLLLPLLVVQPYRHLPPDFWWLLVIMLPCELLAMLLYMKAIRDYPLSLTLPFLAFTPVIITITAFFLLGESISPAGLTGILLVVAGSYVLHSQQADGRRMSTWLRPFQAIAENHGSQLMLLVAALYSITAVLGKAMLNHADPVFFASFYFVLLGMVTILLLPFFGLRSARILTTKPFGSLLVAGFMALMIVTHFMALEQVETAYMITVKRTSLLFGMLYGAYLFRERRLNQNLFAGCLIILGVFFIYYD